jgi:hypothetical protein
MAILAMINHRQDAGAIKTRGVRTDFTNQRVYSLENSL